MLGIEVYVRRYLGLKEKFSAQRKNFHLNYTYMYNWTQTYMYYSFFCSKQIVSNVIPYGFCKKKKKSSLLVDPPHSFFCIYFPFLTPHFTHFPLVRSRAPCYFLLCILVNGPFLFLRYLKLRQDIYWHLKIWSLESLVKGNMWYLSFWVSTLNMIFSISIHFPENSWLCFFFFLKELNFKGKEDKTKFALSKCCNSRFWEDLLLVLTISQSHGWLVTLASHCWLISISVLDKVSQYSLFLWVPFPPLKSLEFILKSLGILLYHSHGLVHLSLCKKMS